MMPLLHLQEGRSANASLTKAEIFIVLQKSFRSFLLLLGALISFVLYIIFLQKNLTDAWAQLPNRGPVLNNWLMGWDAGCDRDYDKSGCPDSVGKGP